MNMASDVVMLGGTMKVYQARQVERAMEDCSDTPNASHLRKVYGKMLERGEDRFVAKPARADALNPVREQCPNFSEIVDDLARFVALAACGRALPNMMPVLLAGDPGVGKTYFSKCLASAMQVPFHFLSMGTTTAGWVLSGSSPTWSGARHGKIAEALIDDQFANSVFLLDELDKCGGDTRYDPYGALLQLMEPETSRHFNDEYLGVDLDASAVFWVATANDLSVIPDHILSRMQVYEVRSPNPEEGAVIAANIYSAMLREHDLPFEPQLQDEVLELLAQIPPREMRKVLLDALGAAQMAGARRLAREHIRGRSQRSKTPIGFTPH
jgi:ATP-dependent Lon protease